MKKIKRVSQLRKERQRLGRRSVDMEKTIRQDWHGLCSDLQPANLAREAFASWTTWISKKIFSRQHSK